MGSAGPPGLEDPCTGMGKLMIHFGKWILLHWDTGIKCCSDFTPSEDRFHVENVWIDSQVIPVKPLLVWLQSFCWALWKAAVWTLVYPQVRGPVSASWDAQGGFQSPWVEGRLPDLHWLQSFPQAAGRRGRIGGAGPRPSDLSARPGPQSGPVLFLDPGTFIVSQPPLAFGALFRNPSAPAVRPTQAAEEPSGHA